MTTPTVDVAALKREQAELIAIRDSLLKLPERRVPGEGPSSHTDMVLVGEAPGASEVLQHRPFVGPSGELLDLMLQLVGIARGTVWITNAVNWRTMDKDRKNRAPTQAEINADAERLESEIRSHSPRLIYCLGATATKAVLGKSLSVEEIRGFPIWSMKYECYCVTTYHPSAVLRDYMRFPEFHKDLRDHPRYLEMELGGVQPPVVDYSVYEDAAQANILMQQLMDSPIGDIAFDIETDGFNYQTDRILELGLAWFRPSTGEIRAAILPMEVAWSRPLLSQLMLKKNAVWHNGKFDVRFLRYQQEVDAALDDDTMLMHYALDERQGVHSLKILARERYNSPWYEGEIKQYLPNSKTPYSRIPNPIRWKYLAFDVYYTLMLARDLRKEMVADEVQHLYKTVLIEGAQSFSKAEMYGICVDMPHREYLHNVLSEELAQRQAVIVVDAAKVGITVTNGKANAQINSWLYDGHKWPLYEGKRTSVKESLERFPDRPETFMLQQFRQTAYLIGTFVNGLPQHMDAQGLIHPDVLMHGTVTGRPVIHDPPLQTAPRKHKDIKRVVCKARPGHVIVAADYDQLEIRVMAWYSRDQNMIDGFTKPLTIVRSPHEGPPAIAMADRFAEPTYTWQDVGDTVYEYQPDFHTRGAALAFEKPWWEITEDERYDYKFVIFGVLYGRGARSLALDPQGLHGKTVKQAQRYIDGLWAAFPDLKAYYADVTKYVLKHGEIVTAFGRKRRFPFIGKDFWYKIEKQIKNFPAQSTASDICVSGFNVLSKELPSQVRGQPLFTVYDSIESEVPEDRVSEAVALVKEAMQNPPLEWRNIPWTVDVEVGPSWGQVKRYKETT